MALGKRLINTSSAAAILGPNPSDITSVQSNTISGGTYRFVDMYMDKINGDKVYYIRNGGFDMNRIALATMSTPFDLSTLSLVGTSTNWSIGSYASRIHGIRGGGSYVITSGYQNSDNNRNITQYNTSSPWAIPTSFTNVAQRTNGTGGTNILNISDDGSKFYYSKDSTHIVQLSLSTPFSISTQSYEKEKEFNLISSDFIQKDYTSAAWHIVNGDWFVGGFTFYVLMEYWDGAQISARKIKAYDTTVAFDVEFLSDRGNSTDYNLSLFSTGGGQGFSVSDFGHFLVGEQDANNGNQEWWLLS